MPENVVYGGGVAGGGYKLNQVPIYKELYHTIVTIIMFIHTYLQHNTSVINKCAR